MKIICKLPNASLEINGIEFEKHRFGVISKEELDAEQVAFFTSIPGYEIADQAPAAAAAPAEEEKPAEQLEQQGEQEQEQAAEEKPAVEEKPAAEEKPADEKPAEAKKPGRKPGKPA